MEVGEMLRHVGTALTKTSLRALSLAIVKRTCRHLRWKDPNRPSAAWAHRERREPRPASRTQGRSTGRGQRIGPQLGRAPPSRLSSASVHCGKKMRVSAWYYDCGALRVGDRKNDQIIIQMHHHHISLAFHLGIDPKVAFSSLSPRNAITTKNHQ